MGCVTEQDGVRCPRCGMRLSRDKRWLKRLTVTGNRNHKRKQWLTLMVTRFPRGFFSKSSSNRFSPAIATAVGKLSLKNVPASSLVCIVARDVKGANSVNVNEPS